MHRRAEWARKSIHAGLVVVPLAAWWLAGEHPAAVRWTLAAGAAGALAIDLIRLQAPRLDGWIRSRVGSMMRPHEERTLTGSTTWLLALGLTFLLFDRSVALSGMAFLAFGDTAAALAGRHLGGPRLRHGRTLAGTTAFLVAALATLPLLRWLDARLAAPALLAGVAVATAGELLSNGRTDNLVVPLASGGAMAMLLRSL